MVLGKLPVQGVLLILIVVGQWPTALAVGAGGGCLDIFSLVYRFFFSFSLSLGTARYRLKYYLKGPLNPKPPANLFIFNAYTRDFKQPDICYRERPSICHIIQPKTYSKQ